MLAALDDLEAGLRLRRSSGPRSTTRTCTPRWSAACWSGSARLGGKLRAGRSRNDQVATDLRLYLRDHARGVAGRLVELADALVEQAERHVDTAAPGMTHLQHAQPVTLRALAAGPRAAAAARPGPAARLGPPGGGQPARRGRAGRLVAAAGPGGRSPRSWASARPSPNSMDAVADRDFVAEFLFVTALIGVHLSRLGEEVVLWTSQEFGWVELDDAFATGSSIMPQKKNAGHRRAGPGQVRPARSAA